MKSKHVIVTSLAAVAVVLAFLVVFMPRSAPSISPMVSPQLHFREQYVNQSSGQAANANSRSKRSRIFC